MNVAAPNVGQDQMLLDRLLANAQVSSPRPLQVACGLGGGGRPLAVAILERAGMQADAISESWIDLDDDAVPATCYSASDDCVIDCVATAGLGPQSLRLPNSENGGFCVALVRDATYATVSLRSLGPPDGLSQVFTRLLRQHCRIPHEIAAPVTERIGYATGLIEDLEDAAADLRDRTAVEALANCVQTPYFRRLQNEITGPNARAAFDLGRILCLLDPPEIELCDEWAILASALSGRHYAISDISLVLQTFPGLFELDREGRQTLVRPSSRLAGMLLLGGVPISASEHFSIYGVLRERALAILQRKDASDRFVARQLPRQASAASVLHELAADPLGVLCSDPLALLRELEADPAQMRKPAGKIVALSSHRLLDEVDRASQLELSARRIGLHAFADELSAQLPGRRWSALWAQSELAHTHRVSINHRAPLLAVASTTHPEGRAFVGAADGAVWRIGPYRHPIRLHGSSSIDAEIRAIAACRVDGRDMVGVGTSSHAVGVLDGKSGELLWLDDSCHADPVSAAVTCKGEETVLLTAGVGGIIYVHPMTVQGAGRVLYDHGSEIRDLRMISVDGVELVVFCAVNGVVGLARLADGGLIASWHMADEVLNSVAATTRADLLMLVAGTSDGTVRQLCLPIADIDSRGSTSSLRCEEWLTIGKHRQAVNRVHIVEDGSELAVLSGASDGSWQWRRGELDNQVGLGHVGPIWSLDLMIAGERRYVITAGGEGACRLWLTEAVLTERITHAQPLAHRGPVSAVELAADPSVETLVITGGADGDVRVAARDLTEGGELLTRHDSEVSALVCVAIDSERSHVISGSVDGTLRLTPIGTHRGMESVVLGIAHEGVGALSIGTLGGRHGLISGGRDGTITTWDLYSRVPDRTVMGCRYGGVQALCHIEDHGHGLLVVGGQEGRLGVFQHLELEEQGNCSVDSSVLCLCQLPGSRRAVLAGLADGRIAVVRDLGIYGQQVSYIQACENEIRGLGTTILGGRVFVACAGLDRRLRLIDIETGESTIDIELDGYALSLSAVGSSVALGSSAGAAVICFPTDTLVLNQ